MVSRFIRCSWWVAHWTAWGEERGREAGTDRSRVVYILVIFHIARWTFTSLKVLEVFFFFFFVMSVLMYLFCISIFGGCMGNVISVVSEKWLYSNSMWRPIKLELQNIDDGLRLVGRSQYTAARQYRCCVLPMMANRHFHSRIYFWTQTLQNQSLMPCAR